MSHDDQISNKSANRPFQEVLEVNRSRRSVMIGGLSLAAGGFLSSSLAFALPGAGKGSMGAANGVARKSSIDFTPVPVAEGSGPMPVISADYQYQVLIPWGESLKAGLNSYEGDADKRPTAAEQAEQIGIGHDGMWFFPFRRSNTRGVLAVNHEFGRNSHVLGKNLPDSLEDVRLSQHAHGMSVVEIRKSSGGAWSMVKGSGYNRRIHINTLVEFSGPVAGSPLIAPEADARGTANNCAFGHTPWNTYLTCEENFNGYFGATGDWEETEARARYGFTSSGFNYGWYNFDSRFDLSSEEYPNEDHRFGWVMEVDPFNPDARPVKRTALGRFKHEGATVVEGRGGRVVVYMGDDQRFDYVYKFVSESNWKSMRAQGYSPLDRGTLYVARFNDDGTGNWLPLTMDNPAVAARFSSQAEVLTFARLAADAAGATPMDRPEWVSVAPNGDVYCTLTNNSARNEADAANPLAPNPDGHIIRWHDTDQHTGTDFSWDIFLIAEETHGEGDERTFSDPDGLWIDPDGRMFIQTDGGQKKGLNNQMLVASTFDNGEVDVRRLFTGVSGDEVTGIAVTPDRRTMFINLQHPGNGDPSLSSFPAPPGSGRIPRDATVVITRKDGGIIGS
jgi:secreted PhoX family phosphatase